MSNEHEWLNLVEVSGPFLAVPVLRDVFPQGLEALPSGRPQRLRRTYEEWRDAVDMDDLDLPALHAAWIDEVLVTALEIDETVVRKGTSRPERLTVSMPEHGVTVAPDLAVVNPTNSDEPLLFIHVYAPDTDLDAARRFDGLAITPADRIVALLRATGCPTGIVTNGERWTLVHVPVGAVASFASWYARLWGQEPETLRAFVSLLGVRRFFGPEAERLPTLFERSLKHQDDVTDALGEQVRRAVEVLVQSLDRADQDRNRNLLRDVDPKELYEAGLTVMMRLVFLLAAEERGLLLLGDPRYDAFYALSSLRMQLRADTEEILERRRSAWSRLLALFRGVYGGIDHPLLRLPAMGGSLFDPDRYPFLEGRKKGTNWRSDPAEPLPIDDRTVLLLLEAIQTFEGRTLSYRALDVEQIGHVYEGLLERTVQRVDDVTLELEGSAKAKNARVALGEIESARLNGADRIVDLLKERSERSEPAIRNAIGREPDERVAARLLSVCRGDVALRDRILPYAELLRTDPWGYPLVHHAGAFVVVLGADRRESGTHYTPKSLTEKIVEETLTPIVYSGPADGAAREDWKLKGADELLDLKVCDPAMGSGAFLVQACRWLADRLVEAWSDMEAAGGRIDDEGRVRAAEDTVGFEPLSRDTEERAILARRLIAERCLYGVDKNPLAVELAKLSLWLTTLAKGRPFGFLDHNLRSGDSLLGIHDLGQLIELDMKPKGKAQLRLFGRTIRSAVDKALALRSQLRSIPIREIGDVEAMAALDAQSRAELALPDLIADALVGTVLSAESAGERAVQITALATVADEAAGGDANAQAHLLRRVKADLSSDTPDGALRQPFHWPLEFPEAFHREQGGFDAFVSNPPFMGGRKISSNFGDIYERCIKKIVFDDAKGSINLVAYFLIRCLFLLRDSGSLLGMIATDSITESDTRKVALTKAFDIGTAIKATSSFPWPGKAGVRVAILSIFKGPWDGGVFLDGHAVSSISTTLQPEENLAEPHPLLSNKGICSDGVKVQGAGFVIDNAEASRLIDTNSHLSEVISRYIVGDDINNDQRQIGSRWVINFWNRAEQEAIQYREAWDILVERVKPYRDSLTKQVHEKCFWKFWDRREEFHNRVRKHGRAIVCSKLSKHFCVTFGDSKDLYSEKVKLFDFKNFSALAVLQSCFHVHWALAWGSTTGETPAYVGSSCFDTFPFPAQFLRNGSIFYDAKLDELDDAAESYARHRSHICADRQKGFTAIYNLLNSRAEKSDDIKKLRELTIIMDQAVADSYGWDDLKLDHDFYEADYLSGKDRSRFTISGTTRREILKRLSELNL